MERKPRKINKHDGYSLDEDSFVFRQWTEKADRKLLVISPLTGTQKVAPDLILKILGGLSAQAAIPYVRFTIRFIFFFFKINNFIVYKVHDI